ncbi:MAG: aminotransferase class V-fold PLP-dependent enzyme, partial [Chlamydiia bacterium]|nr:aminotransferase class V-fold PLP-dependent enzyme [Chlamydiia bacterium]
SSLVLGLEQAFMELQEGRDLLAVEGTRLRNRFETLLTADQKEILSPFSQANRVPHISCLLFPEVSSEALLFLLNETRVYATRGGGNFQNLFRLLTAHAICAERAHCGLSFALSRHTKESEIERAAEEMMRCYRSLRRVSQQCFSTPQQASNR